MKKLIITNLFLLMIAFQGYSTSGLLINKGDTTIPVEAVAARNALRAKDSLDIMVKERQVFLDLKVQYEKLAGKDSVILKMFDKNIALSDLLIKHLQAQVNNQEKQNSNNEKIVIDLQKIIRKKNWTITKILGFSVTSVGVLTFMLLRK